ncbi:MAG: RNA polymerase sigma factor, partial [Acidimicrobiales bacterium]
EGRSAFRTWLYTVARNEALMVLRRTKPTAELTDQPHPMGQMSSIIVNRRSIEQAIDRLPEPYGATMKLRQFDELEYEEIATRLDVPVGTVRSRLAKARELLARDLGAA